MMKLFRPCYAVTLKLSVATMRFLANLLSLLLVAGIVLFIAAIVLIITLAYGLGIGWVLGRLFGLSLFEGAVLAFLASIVGGGAVLAFLRSDSTSSRRASYAGVEGDNEDEKEEDYDAIPANRFTERSGRTFQTWCDYELSNSIYIAFQDNPNKVAFMNASQQQELAIRLAQSAVVILKGKSTRSTSLLLSRAQIERQLRQTGQMPYDDSIMDMAVDAMNQELELNESAYEHIIKLRLWNKEADWWNEVEESE